MDLIEMENSSIMEEGGSRHATIEMSSLESSLQQKIDAEDPFKLLNCCIFRTPKILFRHNAEAFLPIAFSIGPFHHDQKDLKTTQKIKHKYMQGLIGRSGLHVSMFIEAIKKFEKEARESYAGPVVFGEDDFVEMLVLDGCFIIELFRKDYHEDLRDADDPIFTTCSLHQSLFHDLILLENQIPWKVLEVLFDLTAPNSVPLHIIAIGFFNNTFSDQVFCFDSLRSPKFIDHGSKHILDLLRNWLVLSSEEENQSSTGGEWLPFPSATKLKEAGVKFKKVTERNILGVKFRYGTLEIPSLIIDDVTETVFRNLISLEQCIPNYHPIITSYAILMDNLIDTTQDMEILLDKKIIDNWLNPADATESFNKLFIDTLLKEFFYHDLCKEVNAYCDRCWPRKRADLKHKYFNNPWAAIGVVVGGLIFVFTLIQTICSVIQTVK